QRNTMFKKLFEVPITDDVQEEFVKVLANGQDGDRAIRYAVFGDKAQILFVS
ncbi:unnamed protein product, partial [Rotaria sp. Silwood1]